MSRLVSGWTSPLMAALVALLLLGLASPTLAQTAGQADLDEATQLKFNASSMADLERVVELCESALEKGLDQESAKLAKSLVTATLYQHASRYAQAIFNPQERSRRPDMLRQFAIDDLEKALKYDDNLPQVHLMIARLLAMRFGGRGIPQANLEKGRRSADRAVELYDAQQDPESLSKALVVRAGYQREMEERFADLDRAIEVDPKNSDAWRIRGITHVAQSRLQLARGQAEEAKKHMGLALDDFMKLIEENPEDLAAHQTVAELLRDMGDYDKALGHLETAIELNPRSSGAYRIRAKIYREQDKYEEAIRDLDRAVDLTPDDYRVLLERSQYHFENGDIEEARADVDRALEIEPNLIVGVLQRSQIAARQGKFDEAIRDLKRVIQADDLIAERDENRKPNPALRSLLGNIYVQSQRPSRAVNVYGKVLESYPKNVMALRGRADAYLSVGKQAEAVADYEVAYEVAPKDDGILNNLAWVLATSPKDELRDAERAIDLATKACEVTDYKAAHILSTLAAAYAESGDFQKAIEWSSKAVELDDEGIEQLKDELQSYQQGKPWRELQQVEDKGPEPPQDSDLQGELGIDGLEDDIPLDDAEPGDDEGERQQDEEEEFEPEDSE